MKILSLIISFMSFQTHRTFVHLQRAFRRGPCMRRDTLVNACRLTRKRRHCSIKSYFCFLCAQKYSRSFIKLRLNHCCHMDYFNDVFATFLGLEGFSCIAVYAGSESSRISSKISTFVSYIFVTT